jgi:hypothetical protein
MLELTPNDKMALDGRNGSVLRKLIRSIVIERFNHQSHIHSLMMTIIYYYLREGENIVPGME